MLVRQLAEEVPERYRLLPAIADHDEARVAAASDMGRRRAVADVSDIFGGFRIDSLAQAIDVNRCAVFDVDKAFLESLDTSSVVNRLLTMEVTPSRIRLADGTRGERIAAHDRVVRMAPSDGPARIRLAALASALEQGVTAIVNDAAVALPTGLVRVCHQIGRVLGTAAQVNMYISEREAPGFGVHWDDHDVIIVQGIGRKRWEVFAPLALSPVKDRVGRDSCGAKVLSTILEPGSALYIPRGWPHQVSGFPGSLSAHYTIGLQRLSFADAIQRRAKSTFSHEGGWQVADQAEDDELLQKWDASELEHQVGAWRRLLESLPPGSFSSWMEAFSDDLAGVSLEAPLVGGAVFVDHPDTRPEEIALAQGELTFALDRRAAPAISLLFEGGGATLDEVAATTPNLPKSQVVEFVRFLAVRDLVGLAE